jgi:hypothetical protein
MSESAHTTETPSNGNEDNGTAVTVGCKYVFAVPGTVSAIRWWAPTTNTGTYTVGLYEVTDTHTGTLLASAQVEAAGVTGGAWNVTPITTQAVSADKCYVAARHATSGRFVVRADVFTSAGITNGNVTAIQDGTDAPGPGGALLNCTYNEDAALGYPASQFGEPDYYVDLVFDAGATVTGAGAASLGGLAGSAAGARVGLGSGASVLGVLTATATGLRTVLGVGAAAFSLTASAVQQPDGSGAPIASASFAPYVSSSVPSGRIVSSSSGGWL